MTSFLESYMRRKTHIVDKALEKWLPSKKTIPKIIHEAMRYSIFAGGKRLRPILVFAAAELCEGKTADVLPTACAMELIHTYSLIHDDLPAMDNDDLRRGRPTNHKVYGEDIAILAGDALLTRAFELIASNAKRPGVDPREVIEVIRIVAEGAGTLGMIGGQVADIRSDGGRWKSLSRGDDFAKPEKLLEFIHMTKTAALIRSSLEAGARLAGGDSSQITALRKYGTCIGLAFQIQDDILDIVGDKKKLGKKGSDRANQKLTYPALYGIEASQRKARLLIYQARRALSIFKTKSKPLHELADFILNRDY